MDKTLMINKCLSSEHRELGHLLSGFRNFLRMHSLEKQADWSCPESKKLLADLRNAFEGDLPRHFEVEEKELFPILTSAGLVELVELLLDDHKLINGLIEIVKPLIVKAQKTAMLTEAEWKTLVQQGNALVTELSNHAEKEEAGLVPELEDILEVSQADEIYQRYRGLSA